MNERLEKIIANLEKLREKTIFSRTALAILTFSLGIVVILLAFNITMKVGRGSAALGIIFWVVAAAGAAALVYWLRRGWLDLEKTALLCKANFEILDDDLITLVQLGKMLKAGHPDFSLTLFEKHLDQVGEKLARIDLNKVAALERLQIPAAVLALLFTFFAGFYVSLPDYATTIKQALSLKAFHSARSAQMVKVSRPLELYDFVIEYSYPAYSGLGSKKFEGGDGSISALKGTVVSLRAKLPVKVEKAWLQFNNGGSMVLTQKESEISTRMVILDSGQYRVEASDKNGKLWAEPAFHTITSIPDKVPEVTLIEPDKDLVVSQDQKLPLKFQARDDYGIESFSLVFTSRGKEKRVAIKELKPAELDADGEYEWVISEHNLLPGEKTTYYIEAKDNNNVTGPGLGKSQVRYIEVFSPLKKHQEIIAQEQKLFEALIDMLGKSIDAKLAKLTTDQYWQGETALVKNFQDVKALVDALKAEMAKDEYSTALIKDALGAESEKYGAMIQSRKKSLDAENRDINLALREETITRLERDVLFWDIQLKKQRMDYLLSLGDKLKQQEDQLRKLMDEYRESHDPDLLAEIESRLDELKATYQEFLASMAQMDRPQMDEFVNMDALAQKGAGAVMQKLEQFRQSVHDRDITDAMQDADNFLGSLDQMLSELQKGSEQMGQSISKEMMAEMQANMDDLKTIREEQEKLIARTDPIYQSQLQKQENINEQIQKEIESLKSQMDQLSESLQTQMNALNSLQWDPKKTSPDEFNRTRNELASRLWQMEQLLQNAMSELEMKNLQQAAQQMQSVASQMEQAKAQENKMCSSASASGSGSAAFSARGDSSLKSAKNISSRMSGLEKFQKSQLSESEMAQLKKLSLDQGALKDRLAGLERQMQDLFSKLPVAPEKVPGQLGNAELKMRDAQGELDLNNPESGVMAQKEARYWLEQAEKTLDQFKQKVQENSKPGGVASGMQMSGQPGSNQQGNGRAGAKTEDFEIPGREAKNPGEMRKQILKAMREGSPKDYEELNRDYYKRLVQ
jgi:hypothetical protein